MAHRRRPSGVVLLPPECTSPQRLSNTKRCGHLRCVGISTAHKVGWVTRGCSVFCRPSAMTKRSFKRVKVRKGASTSQERVRTLRGGGQGKSGDISGQIDILLRAACRCLMKMERSSLCSPYLMSLSLVMFFTMSKLFLFFLDLEGTEDAPDARECFARATYAVQQHLLTAPSKLRKASK